MQTQVEISSVNLKRKVTVKKSDIDVIMNQLLEITKINSGNLPRSFFLRSNLGISETIKLIENRFNCKVIDAAFMPIPYYTGEATYKISI